ncbi:spiroplasma plectrovirus-related protein [Spiroplasma phoeniceum P40]|uniref:Spiroplasma plectrovirus-related protein n=1 Tax=Spiroplasma phoeniceum P40 TaxID=1276259 RepID=A0A345DPF9_9MOLU|nr:spiroplasma plectrovirus-related protein [Spiroplasma phoeniceum P40]
MFLRSIFFENWSETNYFINPTLKTSKKLSFNDKWYLDFLQDSYSTGFSYDKPSDKFMYLYKNWDNYVRQYNINEFFDVDKKQFLRELTNFVYSFVNKYNLTSILNKLKTNITDFKLVNLNYDFDNWKLVSSILEEGNTKKWYIGIFKKDNRWNIIKWNGNKEFYSYYYDKIYRWDGERQPQTPQIDNNGNVKFKIDIYKQKVKDFLNNYLDVIIQENIRVQQGGSSDYENPNKVGTKRIIFDFETVDELDVKNIRKSIYRMILTVYEANLIISGSLELNNINNDDLSFNFIFIRTGTGEVFNFNGSIYSSLNSKDLKYY